MIKRQYRSGGQIKESKHPDPKSEVKAGPDLVIEGLHKPLPEATHKRIFELDSQGVSRSKIAREVGIPKTRVIHELITLDMKDTTSSKYAPKSYERSSTL
ncbi:hypothetical protein ACIFOE_23460 [Paenibacillus sp. NRS-1783]|uniref:hypothetical protein n=1 Tax=Paenibacillus sp. NRS-1783 TaxID=3233907 RepID=UPI003D27B519